MFKWFMRRVGAPARTQQRTPARERAQPVQAAPASGFGDSTALPEVVNEGNTQADWSMWEDSMTALDSRLQGLTPSARIYVRSQWPSQFDEPDAFGRVGKT